MTRAARHSCATPKRDSATTWALACVAVAAAGLSCDVAGESLLIGWLPRDYDRVAPLATQLTGTAANGLYTLAGIVLTLATPVLPLRWLAWVAWISGIALVVVTVINVQIGVVIATAALMVSFIPFAIAMARQ